MAENGNDFQQPSTRSETTSAVPKINEKPKKCTVCHGTNQMTWLISISMATRPAGFRVRRQYIGRQYDLRVIDLPAAVPGFGHHAPDVTIAKARISIERSAGKTPEVPKPPQLDPGGDAGEPKAKERPQRHIAVGIDHGLGNPGDLGIGQRPHRSGAGDISRDAQYCADDKEDEAASLHDVIVHDERGNVEKEREHKSDRGEVIQDDVDMRPGLRSLLLSPGPIGARGD